jgi:hypothetical protein
VAEGTEGAESISLDYPGAGGTNGTGGALAEGGGSGGGIAGDGASANGATSSGGKSFSNGFVGGTGHRKDAHGGFGGGGGGNAQNFESGGGGGGYSGGGGGAHDYGGGGGGSFSSGDYPFFKDAQRSGHGMVVVTLIKPFSATTSSGPTDITLSNATVEENKPVGTVVGNFSATGGSGSSGGGEPVIITERVGEKLWEFETGGVVHTSPAIGSDGTVYIGSPQLSFDDNGFYALSGKTGVKLWEFETGWGQSSPAIGSDGTVYVGSYDKKLYAINGKSGVKLWEFETGSHVESTPAIGSDGTVYVGSYDKKLYDING